MACIVLGVAVLWIPFLAVALKRGDDMIVSRRKAKVAADRTTDPGNHIALEDVTESTTDATTVPLLQDDDSNEPLSPVKQLKKKVSDAWDASLQGHDAENVASSCSCWPSLLQGPFALRFQVICNTAAQTWAPDAANESCRRPLVLENFVQKLCFGFSSGFFLPEVLKVSPASHAAVVWIVSLVFVTNVFVMHNMFPTSLRRMVGVTHQGSMLDSGDAFWSRFRTRGFIVLSFFGAVLATSAGCDEGLSTNYCKGCAWYTLVVSVLAMVEPLVVMAIGFIRKRLQKHPAEDCEDLVQNTEDDIGDDDYVEHNDEPEPEGQEFSSNKPGTLEHDSDIKMAYGGHTDFNAEAACGS
jgi:hypothetical protein